MARRELPINRRRTEVSVPHGGSDNVIGWHNNSLKDRLSFADAIGVRTVPVCALLAARVHLIKRLLS